MHGFREYVDSGGLMSYGPNTPQLFQRAAEYVDKILRGAKRGDLPVEQPTKFDLTINLKTAKAIGLDVPGIGFDLVPRSPLNSVQIPAKANRGRSSFKGEPAY
jgi:ABC-type uncharacterized transport system substrate-binding protein